MVEVKSPIKGTGHTNHVKSPISAAEKTKKRQSLTGTQPPLSNNSRRSSLGGKPVVACKLNLELRFPISQDMYPQCCVIQYTKSIVLCDI